MQYDFRRLGDGRQAILRETKRAVTPFGGLVVFIEYVRKLRLKEAVRRLLPFEYRSNNAMPPEHTFLAFLLGVITGARRFSHLQMLRCDLGLQALCGMKAFPTDDTVRNFFRRFGAGDVNRFFLPLWRWLLSQQTPRACMLDLDSTVFQRYGRQEGAVRGYNPTRRNGQVHHPLVAFITEPVLVLHSWLRSGNTADCRGAVDFLQEALDLLPAGWTLDGLRADGGFFDQTLFDFLEKRQLPYVVVARRKDNVQRHVRYITQWREVDATYALGEFTVQLPTWARARRFVVLRIRLADANEPGLFATPGFDYRVFVTNRTESAEWIWHHYDQRAAIEPRFSELKEDLGADDFCLHGFFPTEAAVRSIFFVFNLLSLLQTLDPNAKANPQRRPATLRSSLFICGAIAGRSGHKIVLFMSEAWGGLVTRKALLDRIAALQI